MHGAGSLTQLLWARLYPLHLCTLWDTNLQTQRAESTEISAAISHGECVVLKL